MTEPVSVGAVLYEPKVAVIWEIIRDFFEANGSPMDVVFYSNYQLQVRALVGGEIDLAWNSPLAWLDSQRLSGNGCRAIAMRDTDRNRVSHIVARRDDEVSNIDGLRGKTIAVGAQDSPQATLIPLGLLDRNGLRPGEEFQLRRFDVLVGKHGDHVGGELDAFKSLESGDADASTMLDLNWARWSSDGTIDPEAFRIVTTTDRFDHCVFTVREDFEKAAETRFLEALFSMSYDDPDHREMMDLEGLKEWLPGRTTGFGPLGEAVRTQRYFEEGNA